MKAKTHPFDHLNEWRQKSVDELVALGDEKNLVILQRVAELLHDATPESPLICTRENFAEITGKMIYLYINGSRALGNALLDAANELDNNNIGLAREIYCNFIEQCPSDFYRNIARSELKKLTRKGINGDASR